MDLAELPQPARDRIAAAELEAKIILAEHETAASLLVSRAQDMGYDPSGIGFSPGTLPRKMAREKLVEGNNAAAMHLFAAVASEFWPVLKPDVDKYTAKLEEIGACVSQTFRVDATFVDVLKTPWRAKALRARAATGLRQPEQKGDNGTDPDAERGALLQAYKNEGTQRGIRITDKMIAQAASKSWHDRTPVQRWKRNDKRCTKGDDAKIRAVLKNKPHLK